MLDETDRVIDSEIAKAAPEGAEIWRIWPGDGVPPGSESWSWSERTVQVPWMNIPRLYARNIVVPTVTVHRPPAGTANGTALVVVPGGGYHFLMVEQEGHDMARWLTRLGVTVFVLKYRVMRTPDDDAQMSEFRSNMLKRRRELDSTDAPSPHRAALAELRWLATEDARQAIRFARANADDFGIDPHKVGIVGYSAGGGVALGAALNHDPQSRPDYVVGVYPDRPDDLPAPVNAPPLFLVIADDDKLVAPSSTSQLYEAWHASGASAELHVFANGAHGFAMDTMGRLSDIWTTLLENWLRFQGFIEADRQAP